MAVMGTFCLRNALRVLVPWFFTPTKPRATRSLAPSTDLGRIRGAANAAEDPAACLRKTRREERVWGDINRPSGCCAGIRENTEQNGTILPPAATTRNLRRLLRRGRQGGIRLLDSRRSRDQNACSTA